MFKSLLKRMSTTTTAGVERSTISATPQPDYASLVNRIIHSDASAETELVAHFKDPVFHIIRRIANNTSLVEDLSQDTFLIVIRKIRNGDVQQPESLGAFVVNVARYHAIEKMRGVRRLALIENLEPAEQVPDPSPNRLEQLQRSEQLDEIRDLLGQLKPRYRELLLRFYIREEPKAEICADLGLNSAQFDGVLHRARKRYKELYLKRKGLAEKDEHR